MLPLGCVGLKKSQTHGQGGSRLPELPQDGGDLLMWLASVSALGLGLSVLFPSPNQKRPELKIIRKTLRRWGLVIQAKVSSSLEAEAGGLKL